jgi:hypothetical protein
MKTATTFLFGVIITLLTVYLLKNRIDFLSSEYQESKTDTFEIVKYDTLTNTLYKTTIDYVPEIITDTFFEERMLGKDTLQILEDYFAYRIYKDSITGDTVSIYITDTVTENKLTSRKIDYSCILPTVTKYITNTKLIYKKGFYLGGSLNLNIVDNTSIEPSLLYITKNKSAYSLSYGIRNNTLTIGAYYRINK